MSTISLDTCRCKVTFHEDEETKTIFDDIAACEAHSSLEPKEAFHAAIAENNAKNNIWLKILHTLPDQYLNVTEEETIEKIDDLGNTVVTVLTPRRVEFKYPPKFLYDEDRNLTIELVFGDPDLRATLRTALEDMVAAEELVLPDLPSSDAEGHKEKVSQLILASNIT